MTFVCVDFVFWLWLTACGILVPPPGIEPMTPAVEAWSLNHCTTKEVSVILFLTKVLSFDVWACVGSPLSHSDWGKLEITWWPRPSLLYIPQCSGRLFWETLFRKITLPLPGKHLWGVEEEEVETEIRVTHRETMTIVQNQDWLRGWGGSQN